MTFVKNLNIGGLLLALLLQDCSSCKQPGTTETKKVDTTQVAKTIPEIIAAKPAFKDYKHYTLNTQQDTTYIRSVSNTDNLKKVWIVYYDFGKNDWQVRTWIGTGEPNKVFGDTILVRKTRQGETLGDNYDIYMAYSNDKGKTWESYDPSPAHLYCAGNPRNSNAVQLLVSNDFFNSDHIPSLGIMIQWKKPFIISGTGITGSFEFKNYCEVIRKISRKP